MWFYFTAKGNASVPPSNNSCSSSSNCTSYKFSTRHENPLFQFFFFISQNSISTVVNASQSMTKTPLINRLSVKCMFHAHASPLAVPRAMSRGGGGSFVIYTCLTSLIGPLEKIPIVIHTVDPREEACTLVTLKAASTSNYTWPGGHKKLYIMVKMCSRDFLPYFLCILLQGESNDRIVLTAATTHPESASARLLETWQQVRLTDGPNVHTGRLQIYHNEEWRSVCSNSRK